MSMTTTIGLDLGNKFLKVCGKDGVLIQDSTLGEYRDMKLKSKLLPTDIVYCHEGVKGFAGTLAIRESEFARSIRGKSKAHNDTLIRCLIGLHLYCTKYHVTTSVFNIVVGQPIISHLDEEKNKIKEMLKGKHTIEVNGVVRTFYIQNVIVAVEGASAFWINRTKAKIRIIDVGSGTINYATIDEGHYIDRDSDTMLFGTETTKSKDYSAMAKGIIAELTNKWDKEDAVYLVGGAAIDVFKYIKEHFINTSVLYIQHANKTEAPVFANAVGFYMLGVFAYEQQSSKVN